MMPGNYARMMFNEINEEHLLKLVSREYQTPFKEIFKKIGMMRKVYRENNPDPHEVKQYKSVAVEFGQVLLKQFDFAKWPNYIHKVIEHVQELIDDKRGLGQ